MRNLLTMQAASQSAAIQIPAADMARDALWDLFVSRHATPHFLQTTGWARLKSQFGWASHRVAMERQDGSVIAGAQCLSIRRYGVTMGYIPRGPLVDWGDKSQTLEVKERLLQLARAQGWHFLMIEPDLEDLPANRAILQELGFRPSQLSIQPRSTIRVDLAVSGDELVARMKSKWRYNIRKAYRSGVQVRSGTTEDLETFQVLLEETGRRQGFSNHSLTYHQTAFESLPDSCLQLFLADVAADTVAAIVVARVGLGAWYPWGASSTRHRQAMPNFALHHAAMLWAKEQGAVFYDLWGIPEPLGALARQERLHGHSQQWPTSLPVALDRLPPRDLWTVYRMKQGFGGQIVHLVGAWDLPVQLGAYRLFTLGAIAQERLRQRQNSWSPRLSARSSFPKGSARQSASVGWQTETNGAHWDIAVGACAQPHFMQSWAWGEQMARLGWHPLRKRMVLESGQCAGTAQVLIRDIRPHLPWRMAYVPGGPDLHWENGEAAFVFLEQLAEILHQERVALIRIAPHLRRDRATGLSVLSRLEDAGWHFSRSAWIQKDRGVSSWPALSALTRGAAHGRHPDPSPSYTLAGGTVRHGTASDIERLSELANPAPADSFEAAKLIFGREIWTDPQHGNEAGGQRPHSTFILAEDPEAALTGAALVVAWNDEAWFFTVPGKAERLPPWALGGLQRLAVCWARAQGCTRLDWGSSSSLLESGLRLPTGSGSGIFSPRPLIGTWSRLLWPLPGRVAPGVLQCLEGLLVPIPPIRGNLPV